jgi:hypothetical protein
VRLGLGQVFMQVRSHRDDLDHGWAADTAGERRARDCGFGTGECDSGFDDMPMVMRADWGCETTALIATQLGVAYPAGADS